jgi:hypothetical protein
MTQPPPPGEPGVDDVRHVDLSDENPVQGVRPWPTCRVDLNGEPVGQDVGRPSTSRDGGRGDVRWPRRLPRPATFARGLALLGSGICALAMLQSQQVTQVKQLCVAAVGFCLGGLTIGRRPSRRRLTDIDAN